MRNLLNLCVIQDSCSFFVTIIYCYYLLLLLICPAFVCYMRQLFTSFVMYDGRWCAPFLVLQHPLFCLDSSLWWCQFQIKAWCHRAAWWQWCKLRRESWQLSKAATWASRRRLHSNNRPTISSAVSAAWINKQVELTNKRIRAVPSVDPSVEQNLKRFIGMFRFDRRLVKGKVVVVDFCLWTRICVKCSVAVSSYIRFAYFERSAFLVFTFCCIPAAF